MSASCAATPAEQKRHRQLHRATLAVSIPAVTQVALYNVNGGPNTRLQRLQLGPLSCLSMTSCCGSRCLVWCMTGSASAGISHETLFCAAHMQSPSRSPADVSEHSFLHSSIRSLLPTLSEVASSLPAKTRRQAFDALTCGYAMQAFGTTAHAASLPYSATMPRKSAMHSWSTSGESKAALTLTCFSWRSPPSCNRPANSPKLQSATSPCGALNRYI